MSENLKPIVEPNVLARLRALSWEDKKTIAESLGAHTQSVHSAINREARTLLNVEWINAMLPYSGVDTVEKFWTYEKITKPFEVE